MFYIHTTAWESEAYDGVKNRKLYFIFFGHRVTLSLLLEFSWRKKKVGKIFLLLSIDEHAAEHRWEWARARERNFLKFIWVHTAILATEKKCCWSSEIRLQPTRERASLLLLCVRCLPTPGKKIDRRVCGGENLCSTVARRTWSLLSHLLVFFVHTPLRHYSFSSHISTLCLSWLARHIPYIETESKVIVLVCVKCFSWLPLRQQWRTERISIYIMLTREYVAHNIRSYAIMFKISQNLTISFQTMLDKEKKRFHEMAEKDKQRYDLEMSNYVPPKGVVVGRGKKRKHMKDPNAPKRSLSAFFWFCHDERNKVKAANPEYGVGDIAKELGRKWSDCDPETKGKYEAMADKDKQRYERVSWCLFWRKFSLLFFSMCCDLMPVCFVCFSVF